ncbi:MAG: hypothetical protein DCC75_01125 [Proteobacteria bacterium]|nr:MAG: hypothetical protein DCC75_01125 [Pseudomonadota bacterium]
MLIEVRAPLGYFRAVDTKRQINTPLVLALLILPPLLSFGLGLPHPNILAIFITTIGLWLTEAVPLPVTGLLVPVLASLYGVLPAAKAFDSFGSDILFLFLGCFLMGRSMEKHGFDKRLAYYLLGRLMPGSSFLAINLVMGLTSFVLSMWISNTSATAILSAVTLGILTSLDPQIPDEEVRHKVAVRLLLTCAFAASIGGLATPVGSPPNLIALKFLAQKDITISFVDWILIGLPISLVMFMAMIAILALCFPLRKLSFPGIQEKFRSLLRDLGPMSAGEKEIAAIFAVTVILWVAPGVLNSIYPELPWVETLNSRYSMSVVGLMGGLATFFLPVRDGDLLSPNLVWSETDKVEWGTLMMFGGGLTLGVLLEESGAAADLGRYLFEGGGMSGFALACLVVVASILMSEFASNTAAASILIPLILGAAIARGAGADVTTNVVLAATFGASFGFMLPVSTPPNAIVYGTGRVPASDMRKAGVFFDILGALLIIVYMLVLR